jgi:hypothetical protein
MMRGYLSFLLVLASLLLVIMLLVSAAALKDFSLSRAIAAERTYQLQMNIKEVVLEAGRQGAVQAFTTYSFTHSKDACIRKPMFTMNPDCFKDVEAMQQAKEGAYDRIKMLTAFDPDYAILLWCGLPLTESEARNHSAKMITDSSLSLPFGRFVFFSLCDNSISVSLEPSQNPNSNPTLKRIVFGESGIVIGASVYSNKFGAASTSHIPAGTEVIA